MDNSSSTRRSTLNSDGLTLQTIDDVSEARRGGVSTRAMGESGMVHSTSALHCMLCVRCVRQRHSLSLGQGDGVEMRWKWQGCVCHGRSGDGRGGLRGGARLSRRLSFKWWTGSRWSRAFGFPSSGSQGCELLCEEGGICSLTIAEMGGMGCGPDFQPLCTIVSLSAVLSCRVTAMRWGMM